MLAMGHLVWRTSRGAWQAGQLGCGWWQRCHGLGLGARWGENARGPQDRVSWPCKHAGGGAEHGPATLPSVAWERALLED